MNKILLAACAVASCAAFAETEPEVKPVALQFPVGTSGRTYTLSDEFVVQPKTMKGRIVIVDAQNLVDKKEAKEVSDKLFKQLRYDISCVSADNADVQALKKANRADILIVAVADDKTPPMLVAPEEGWAVVNFRKMDKNLKTDDARKKFFVPRCRKQLIRAFSLVCGGGSSTFPGNVMNASRIEDIDLYDEGIPMDLITSYESYLKKLNVSPMNVVPYWAACMDGWAPKPETELRKRIWKYAEIEKNKQKKTDGK